MDEGEAIGIAPHSLRAVTPSELSELMSLAGGGPIHIHAAEQVKEVEDCVASLGARPVRWLLDHAGVDARWCLVHATHIDEDETRDLARSGAVAGLCPITEANLGDGVFNATDYIRAGGRYGIGTDSNVSIGVAAELRQLEYAQRLRERERNVCAPPGASCGRTMLEAIWSGGAQALRRNSGRLAPGRGGRHSHLSRRPSDASRQGRRSGARRVDFLGRQSPCRLRLERRTEGRRRRPARVQRRDRRAIHKDDARTE